jgi:hypothetical protein
MYLEHTSICYLLFVSPIEGQSESVSSVCLSLETRSWKSRDELIPTMSTTDPADDPNWRPQPRETIENRRIDVEQQRIVQQRNPGAALILILLFLFLGFGGSSEPYLVREQLSQS